MRYGLSLGRLHPKYWDDVVVEADRLGFESVWLAEHLVMPTDMSGSPFPGDDHPPVPPDLPIYDAPAYLSYLAGRTNRIRFGTYVYLLGYRHPFTSARMFQTLDVVSGGRTEVGVGAGWLRGEAEAAGIDFSSRGRRLNEAIDVCRRLWTESRVAHDGEFWQFDEVAFEPKPVQDPHPPILVGGESAPALRRAAERGDGWLSLTHTPESAAIQIEKLHKLRAEAGRSGRFEITITPEAFDPADLEAWNDLGVHRLIVAPWARSREALDGITAFAAEHLN